MKMVAESKLFTCFGISIQVIGAVSRPAFKALSREPLAAFDWFDTAQSQAITHN